MTQQINIPDNLSKLIYDYLFLFEFLKLLKPKNSLEIGVYKGLTFQLLHKYSKHSLGVEINYENKSRYSYPQEWDIVFKDSFLLTQDDLGSNKFFDFIHIDGCHGYEAVINDLEKCLPHINNTTIICVDDYTHMKEVSDGVKTFIKSNKKFFLKSIGISQAFFVTGESEIIFDQTVANFKKEMVTLLQLKPILKTMINPVDETDMYVIEKLSKEKQFAYLQNTIKDYLKLSHISNLV